VSDEAVLAGRQSAYVESLRAQGRPQRVAGFIACLAGVLILVIARYRLSGAPWLLWTGVAVVGLGWALFVYAVARRLMWARAHPFDPNG
jgi:hypothetical protein